MIEQSIPAINWFRWRKGSEMKAIKTVKRTMTLVNGFLIQWDASGQGHSWRNASVNELPAAVRTEIEGEMIDGGHGARSDFVASNGQHYRW